MTVPSLTLSQKQSNAWHYLEDNETTELLYGGAAGGGKSYLGCMWHIYRRVKYAGTRGLIGRNKLTTLKQSTLITFFEVAGKMGYYNGTHFTYNAQDNTVKWINGSLTHFKDLAYYPSDPDFNSLGSTEYTDAFIDEAPEVTEKVTEILSSRLRYKVAELGLVPKMLLTCNPSPGWVKKRFVMDEERIPVTLHPYQKFIRSLVTDNPDAAFVRLYLEQLNKLKSDYDKQRLIYGDWDVVREVQNAFATQYQPAIHESTEAVFRPTERLIIGIDFNLTPFAVSFAHMFYNKATPCVHFFDEGKIQKGSIPAMIEYIKSRYGKYLSNCIITGDSLGKNRQLGQQDNVSFYGQLQKGLGLRNNQIVVPNNPTHTVSRADCNYFLDNFPEFRVNPVKCPNLCLDLRNVECDAFGQILKADRKNESQRADFLDTFRYVINTFLKKWIIQHQNKK